LNSRNRTKPRFWTLALIVLLALAIVAAGCSGSGSQNNNNSGSNGGGNSQTTTGGQSGSGGAGNSDGQQSGPQYGGHVKVRTHSQMANFGFPPEQRTPSTENTNASPALETLGRYDSEGKMQPWLAESWEVDAESLKIKIKLREGIKFHDDTDFNAEAVKWNIEQWHLANRAEIANIESVQVIDTYNLELKLKTWQNSTLDDLLWMVQIVSPTAYEKNGKEWMLTHPVGTGPFVFDSFTPDVSLKFVRNENYWQPGLPYLDSFEWVIIPDQNTAKNAFMGKEVDIVLFLTGSQVDEFRSNKDVEVVPLASPIGQLANGIIGDSVNPNSPFHNVKVRQAIGYAVDRKLIAETIYMGYVTPTNQFGAPGVWAYNPDLPFEYNPEKAKQLLAEAGYPNGFSTTITGMPQHSDLMAAIQAFLADVGINVEVNVVESAKYHAQTAETYDGMMVYAYTTDADITSTLNRHFGPNAAIWGPNTLKVDEVFNLIQEAAGAKDEAERIAKTHALQKAVYQDHALVTSLYVNTTPYLRHPWVHDDGFYTIRGNLFTPEKMWVSKK